MEAGRRSIHVFWWLLALTLLMPASTQAALPQMGTLNVVAQFIFRGRGDLPTAGTRAAASGLEVWVVPAGQGRDRKSTRLNSSHSQISYAVFCLKKKKTPN